MLNFNKAMLSGRITKDPELRHTPNNIPVTTFTIAVNRRAKAGEQAVADFIDVVVWRNTAEFVCKYFRKGSGIFVTGSIQTRTWTDNDNKSRKNFEIVADEVYFAESKRDSGDNGSNEFINNIDKKDSDAPAINNDFQELTEDDDSLPF